MNPMTGKIQEYPGYDELLKAVATGFAVPVNPDDMTGRQRRDMQVSKHDNRSELGKLFGLNRAARRRLEKERHNQGG